LLQLAQRTIALQCISIESMQATADRRADAIVAFWVTLTA
jgi:hypothetical protein